MGKGSACLQQKSADVVVLDAVAAAVDLIHGDDELGVVVGDGLEGRKFALHGRIVGQQVGDLKIDFCAAFPSAKIDFERALLADGHFVSASHQLHEDNILEGLVDVAMICDGAMPFCTSSF